jgi:UrcA family protein
MSRKALLLSAAFLAATPSFAAPETATGTLVLAGLNLSTSVGIAEAHKRLTILSERLCAKFRDVRKVDDWENYADCVHHTLASALERIQTPTASIARTDYVNRNTAH